MLADRGIVSVFEQLCNGLSTWSLLLQITEYAIINTYYYYHGCDFEDNTIMKKYALSRSLLIERFDITAQNLISLPIKNLFVREEYLCLRNLRGDYKNIIPSMDQQSMNQLIALVLEHCSKI